MTRRVAIACLTLVCTLVIQRTGEAGDWGWLEKLSGPGPFGAKMPGLNFPVVCIREDGSRDLLFCDKGAIRSSSDIRGMVGVEIQRWKSRENVLFLPNPAAESATVRILDFRPNVMIRVAEAVDIGVSAGFHRFTGPAFDSFWKMSVEPIRTSIAPLVIFHKGLALRNDGWYRVLKVDAGITRFVGKFTREDFCTAPGCDINQMLPFSAEGEYQWRSALVLDFSSVVWR